MAIKYKGIKWFEEVYDCLSINYRCMASNPKKPAYRILYSNDGLIYGTYDHYDTVFQTFS